jgi:hypothetical protein
MLTANVVSFGRPAAAGCTPCGLGQTDTVELPEEVVDRLSYLSRAGDKIWNAHEYLTIVSSVLGGLPTELGKQYNDSLGQVALPIELAFAERNGVEGVIPEAPNLPDTVAVVSETTDSGLGVAFLNGTNDLPNFIPSSQLRFVARNGTVRDLSGTIMRNQQYRFDAAQTAALYGLDGGRGYGRGRTSTYYNSGLGIVVTGLTVAVVSILAVAFIGHVIQRISEAHYTAAADKAAAYADAQRADAQARLTNAVMGAYSDSLTKCANRTMSASELAKCMEKAGEAAAKASKSVPEVPAPSARSRAGNQLDKQILVWGATAAAIGVGIFLFRKYKKQKETRSERPPRARARMPEVPSRYAADLVM